MDYSPTTLELKFTVTIDNLHPDEVATLIHNANNMLNMPANAILDEAWAYNQVTLEEALLVDNGKALI